MALWSEIEDTVFGAVGDSSEIFHTRPNVLSYAQQAEMLLSMSRQLVEVTGSLKINKKPVYKIHTTFPDFIWPLRVVYNNVPLVLASLESISMWQPLWYRKSGIPNSFFMIGATYLGFNPFPLGGTLQVTYLGVPPTTGTGPTIQAQWQQALESYASAIALGKETQLDMARQQMKEFVQFAGIRDVRLLETSGTKGEKKPITQSLIEPED